MRWWLDFMLTLAVVPLLLFSILGMIVLPGTGDRVFAGVLAIVCVLPVGLGLRRFCRGRVA